jgi:12-oxophytodienoic acid reductase
MIGTRPRAPAGLCPARAPPSLGQLAPPRPRSTSTSTLPRLAAAAAAAAAPTVPGLADAAGAVPVVPSARPLFAPIDVGALRLAHRLVLAPLTRCRSDPGYVAAPSAARYYAQRADAPGTLLVTEASPVCAEACGYPNTPGIWTDAQVRAWRPVVDAVHARGSFLAAQLWHVGRASCGLFQPGGRPPAAPSPIAIREPWTLYGPDGEGPLAYPVPRALTKSEIDAVVADYARAARNALHGAKFDLVEIHAANGYLLSQFLSDGANERDDEYGGGAENRARLLLRVAQAVVDAAGSAARVGVRLSPFNEFLDCVESQPLETYGHAVDQLLKLRAQGDASGSPLAYLHFVEPRLDATFEPRDTPLTLAPFTARCRAAGVPVVTAGGWEPGPAARAVAAGEVDLVCVGREWIGAPDLPKRWALGLRGSKGDRALYYSGGEKGYSDYEALTDEEERAAVERARALAASEA